MSLNRATQLIKLSLSLSLSLDPPLWTVVPNKALSLSLSRRGSRIARGDAESVLRVPP